MGTKQGGPQEETNRKSAQSSAATRHAKHCCAPDTQRTAQHSTGVPRRTTPHSVGVPVFALLPPQEYIHHTGRMGPVARKVPLYPRAKTENALQLGTYQPFWEFLHLETEPEFQVKVSRSWHTASWAVLAKTAEAERGSGAMGRMPLDTVQPASHFLQ